MTDFIDELQWRGMIHDVMPGAKEQLEKEMTAGYVGYDPTAASLHIGNLATIMLLKHLQLAGHKPIALVGGATGMIGDPSGKSQERNLLDEETLRLNQEGIRNQLAKFLNFEGNNAAEIVNNYDWFKDFSFLGFLRDAGKHLTVNYMMAKDSVKKRLETGLSFTEFSYQLLQGYDFYHLYKEKNVKLQMGGSDQWGNITSGTELVRRMGSGEAYALTCPLITKADGSKFGKSEGGNIWLDPTLTSPYKFYQFWLSVSDDDAPKLIRVFTLFDKEKIEALEAEHAEAPHLRVLQKAMAIEITTRVHSAEDCEMAIKASTVLFGKNVSEALKSLNESTLLSLFEGVPQYEVAKTELTKEGASFFDILSHVSDGKMFKSKGEARRDVKNGAISINREKITDIEATANIELLQDKYVVMQKGKKNYVLVKAV